MRYGDVMKVYGPPVDQVYPNIPDVPPSRVMLPLRSYACGNTQKNWDRKPPIGFSTMGRPGVKLLNAANGEFKGIDDRDDSPFDAVCRGITIRIHVGSWGHRSSYNNSSLVLSSRGILLAPRLRGD